MSRDRSIGDPQRLTIRVVDDETIGVAGELDSVGGELLTAALEAVDAIDRVDMSQVTFFDSSGIRAFLTARHQRGAALTIVDPSPVVRRVLELTGLNALLAGDSIAAPNGARPVPSPKSS